MRPIDYKASAAPNREDRVVVVHGVVVLGVHVVGIEVQTVRVVRVVLVLSTRPIDAVVVAGKNRKENTGQAPLPVF